MKEREDKESKRLNHQKAKRIIEARIKESTREGRETITKEENKLL